MDHRWINHWLMVVSLIYSGELIIDSGKSSLLVVILYVAVYLVHIENVLRLLCGFVGVRMYDIQMSRFLLNIQVLVFLSFQCSPFNLTTLIKKVEYPCWTLVLLLWCSPFCSTTLVKQCFGPPSLLTSMENVILEACFNLH